MRGILSRLAASGVLWSGIEAGASAGLSFVSAFVVARIVGPGEVGIGAAAVALHILFWVPVNALFGDAMVQSPSLTARAASSAFWAAGAIGGAAACAAAALGVQLATILGDPRVVPMSCLLAAALPLVGAGGAVQGKLTRDRCYRVLAGRALIGQGLGTATGIACALAGAGAWALVLQQAVTSVVGAASLLIRARWRPERACGWSEVRALLWIGVPLTASTLVQQGRYRAFAMLIGGTAGAAALGQVHMAFRLVDTVRELLSSALWRLILPTMARRQDDLPALRAGVDRCLELSGLVVFPLIGGLLLTVRPVVEALLGPVWAPSADGALPLLLLMAPAFLSFPGGVAVVARGRAHYTLYGNLASCAAMVAGVLLIRPATPGAAAWIWVGAQLLVLPYTLMVTARVLEMRPLRQWRGGVPPLLVAALATCVALVGPDVIRAPDGALMLIAIRLTIAVPLYGFGAWVLLRAPVRGAVQAILPRVATGA